MENSSKNGINEGLDVVIIGNFDIKGDLFSNIFPLILNHSKYKHKYVNRFDLCLREEINIPNNFINVYYPEINDKLKNIDILVLTYNLSSNTSIENLKRFYYFYYNKLEEKDKPKGIIIIEFNYFQKEEIFSFEKNDINNADQFKKLFKGYFCQFEDDEEKLNEAFSKCVIDLKQKYNFNEDYIFFKKKLKNEIKFMIVIQGDKELQDIFMKILLESCNFNYTKKNNNIFELKYERIINGNKLTFIITIKLMNYDCLFYSGCNIILYDINKKESYDKIKKIIREFIKNNGPNIKILFNLFYLNSNPKPISYEENFDEIKNGKNLANEIGASFSILNINNNINLNEEIKNKFDNILENIIECINIGENKNENNKDNNEIIKKQIKKNNNYDFFELKNYDSPLLYIKEINNKIQNEFKGDKKILINICPKCYEHLNISINNISNNIILYCNKCKNEPKGLNSEQYISICNAKNKLYQCQICQKTLCYEFKTKKLYCTCESNETLQNTKKNITIENDENIPISCLLKDIYCNNHNKFHKYYYKYSKKGLCEDCAQEKKGKKYFIEDFNEEKIDNLIKQKKLELKKELKFINSLHQKFNETIELLKDKFEKLINIKIKMNFHKSQLINSLEIIQNNYTIISNVKSLKFDIGENFKYKEDDSIENKLKNMFKYLNYESDLNNLHFEKKYEGPYNIIIDKEKDIKITDICGLKNNQLFCISFNDGQAKIFNSNTNKNNYPICIIKEFSPQLGVNSLYVSKFNNNIWKIDDQNKNDIIYLNGFEELKIIQMNNNYESYNLLYIIKDVNQNFYSSIEIDYNKIITLNNNFDINLIIINKEKDNKISHEIKNINDLFVSLDSLPISLKKISDNIISLELSSFDLSLRETENRITLFDNDEFMKKKQNLQRSYALQLNDGYINYSPNEVRTSTRESNIRETLDKISENEKFVKIFYIDVNYKNENKELNEENNIKDKCNNYFQIKKEFVFSNNYELLGSISDEENLLLFNYKEQMKTNIFEYKLCIFNFNICQFIRSFKFHNIWSSPKLFAKINKMHLNNEFEFTICDEELNIFQYIYDKNYMNKIYYINDFQAEKRTKNKPTKLISLGKRVIILCNNSYYIFSY